MTPEDARTLIDGIEYNNKRDMWGAFQDRYSPYNVYELAETVAGLKYQYAVEVCRGGEWVMDEDSYWGPFSVASVRNMRTTGRSRLVRRLVGESEVWSD